MTGLSLTEVAFLALGVVGFILFGCCLVHRITYAESLVPDVCRAVAVSLAALLLILTAPAPNGATR